MLARVSRNPYPRCYGGNVTSVGRIACSRLLCSCGRGGEFTQPLLHISHSTFANRYINAKALCSDGPSGPSGTTTSQTLTLGTALGERGRDVAEGVGRAVHAVRHIAAVQILAGEGVGERGTAAAAVARDRRHGIFADGRDRKHKKLDRTLDRPKRGEVSDKFGDYSIYKHIIHQTYHPNFKVWTELNLAVSLGLKLEATHYNAITPRPSGSYLGRAPWAWARSLAERGKRPSSCGSASGRAPCQTRTPLRRCRR